MLRALTKADIPKMLIVEQDAHIAPWSEETFNVCFRTGCVGWAIELDGKIIAFVLISMRIGECHILNVCVLHDYQRQGWGRKLIEQAVQHAKDHGLGIAYLEVRRTNKHAIALYRKMRFYLIGERKDYYLSPAGNEDALVFGKNLIRDD